MVSNPGFSAFNLGNGNGFSILDIISACEKIMSKKLTYKFEPRRSGDPDILVADSTLASKQLNWKPNNSSIENILQTALNWHKKSSKQ
jgi:UDP-glucose 4-epimerase